MVRAQGFVGLQAGPVIGATGFPVDRPVFRSTPEAWSRGTRGAPLSTWLPDGHPGPAHLSHRPKANARRRLAYPFGGRRR
jgi:hypothetical protein